MVSIRSALLAAGLVLATPAFAAAPQPAAKVLPGQMTGRWYEVARLPNANQRGCQADISDWRKTGDGWSVVQVCHKGSVDAPPTEWRAKARVVDPATNAKIKLSFFGGLVSQEYWVLENRPDQGWLILSTANGKYLWLMSSKPTLPAAAKAQAVARIKQLGFDVGRLEFPLPAKG